jgi:hypothetical protein
MADKKTNMVGEITNGRLLPNWAQKPRTDNLPTGKKGILKKALYKKIKKKEEEAKPVMPQTPPVQQAPEQGDPAQWSNDSQKYAQQ